MEFLCWLKGAAFFFSVALTIIFVIAAYASVVFVLVRLYDKISDAVKGSMPNAATIGSYAWKTIGITLLTLMLIAGLYGSKRKVCLVGFKKAYVEFFSSAPAVPAPAIPCCGADSK